MDNADQIIEQLLADYHTADDKAEVEKIERTVKGWDLNCEDLAIINNAFFHFKDFPERNGLINHALETLVEKSFSMETPELFALYQKIDAAGNLAVYIEEHLGERMITCQDWLKLIKAHEFIDNPLMTAGAKFILEHSKDPLMLADLHGFTKPKSHLRVKIAKRILKMRKAFTYDIWLEISSRCAFPSALWSNAEHRLDNYYEKDKEKDLPANTDDP